MRSGLAVAILACACAAKTPPPRPASPLAPAAAPPQSTDVEGSPGPSWTWRPPVVPRRRVPFDECARPGKKRKDHVSELLAGVCPEVGPPGAITGWVYDDRTDTPLGSVEVMATSGVEPGKQIVLSARTDPHGDYRIDNVRPGYYGVRFLVAGSCVLRTSVVVGWGQTTAAKVRIDPSRPSGSADRCTDVLPGKSVGASQIPPPWHKRRLPQPAP